jgi:predicted nuclease of predicted toxin-antitoxin system
MRILADENLKPSHLSALTSAGHDVKQVRDVLDTGASDSAVLDAARDADRVVVTYDRKDFAAVTDHAGVCIATETMAPRDVRRAVDRVERAYPALDDAVEFLSDWL